MNDDARIEIETRLVFQEDAIAKLNDALVDQQRQLDQMRETLARLIDLIERRNEPPDLTSKTSAAALLSGVAPQEEYSSMSGHRAHFASPSVRSVNVDLAGSP